MNDVPRGLHLSKEAFALWEAGRLEEAAERYAQAVEALDSAHWWSPSNHSELATVLRRLGRHDDALAHFETALEQELALYGDEESPCVVTARSFLAEHLLVLGKPAEALEVLAPSLALGGKVRAFSKVVEAEALALLGQRDRARLVALEAVALSAPDKQRARVVERLKPILGQSVDGL